MTTATPPTTPEMLLKVLDSIRTEFVNKYTTVEALHGISTTTKLQNSTEIEELIKLNQLIKARSTKIGILLDTKRFTPNNFKILHEELQGLAQGTFYLLSLLPLFYKDKNHEYPTFFINSMDHQIIQLLNNINLLCDEIALMLEDKEDEETTTTEGEEDNKKLIPIGLIWSTCDELLKLGEVKPQGLLSLKINGSIQLVDDVLLEVDEWLEEPGFGLDKDMLFSDEEDDEDEVNEEDEAESLKLFIPFMEGWKNKIKMIKLLLSSFSKSIKAHKNIKDQAENLDKLEQLHQKITESLDVLISDVLMSSAGTKLKEFDEDIDDLNINLKNMIKVIKDLNKNDEKRNKWIQVWDTKYFST